LQHTDRGNKLVLRPEMATRIIDAVNDEALRVMGKNEQPIILLSPLIRAQFRKMIESSNPNVIVLSYNEIAQGVNIKSIGMVKADKNEN